MYQIEQKSEWINKIFNHQHIIFKQLYMIIVLYEL